MLAWRHEVDVRQLSGDPHHPVLGGGAMMRL